MPEITPGTAPAIADAAAAVAGHGKAVVRNAEDMPEKFPVNTIVALEPGKLKGPEAVAFRLPFVP